MQENQNLTSQELAGREATTTGMTFDAAQGMNALKKFQNPLCFRKAQFSLKRYRQGASTQ